MIKFFLGIAIVAFTSLCGYLLANKYRQRKLFFKQFNEFNERFLNEIAYYRRPIKEFLSVYSYQGEFNDLLTALFSAIKNKAPTESIFAELSKYSFLKEEEKRTVEDYFFMLGKGDSASQRGYFSSLKTTLAELEKESFQTAKRYVDLYVKLGFLCGLLFLILLI